MPNPNICDVLPPALTRADLEKLVAAKIAEALGQNAPARAEDSDEIIRPWFGTRAEYAAFKRQATVSEQKKWALYFAEYGCLHCHCTATEAVHASLGFCHRCRGKVAQRLQRLISKSDAKREAKAIPLLDTQKVAQDALAPSLERLNAERRLPGDQQ